MRRIDLINPRNPLAPPTENGGTGHIWKPDSLINLSSRLNQSGIDTKVHDENLRPADINNDSIIGFTLVGAPWIPVVARRIEEIRQEINPEAQFLIGGQLVRGLSDSEIFHLFGPNVVSGMTNDRLREVLGHKIVLPSREDISVVKELRNLPEENMRKYLYSESSIYISDGCIYKCSFCAAKKGAKEQYRSSELIEEELRELYSMAETFGIDQLRLYTSSLDLFQTPERLKDFVSIVERVQADYEIELQLRGLATLHFFLKTCSGDRGLLTRLRRIGLDRIDFGVDGAPGVWKKILKSHNKTNRDLTEEAILIAAEHGIGVGLFMVIGHPGVDTEDTLSIAYDILADKVSRHGVIPRPYVSNNYVPGGDSWNELSLQKMILLSDPRYFYSLEYAAKANFFKGQSPGITECVNQTYEQMLQLPGCTTKLVEPIKLNMSEQDIQKVKKRNYGQYDL